MKSNFETQVLVMSLKHSEEPGNKLQKQENCGILKL